MNPYTILGISQTASKDEAKKAFRTLAQKHHPDHGGDAKKFNEIRIAYDTIEKSSGPIGQILNPRPGQYNQHQSAEAFRGNTHFHAADVSWADLIRNFSAQMGELTKRQMANDEKNRTATSEQAYRYGSQYEMRYNPNTRSYEVIQIKK